MFLNMTARLGKFNLLPIHQLALIGKFFFKVIGYRFITTEHTSKTVYKAIRKGIFDEQWWFEAICINLNRWFSNKAILTPFSPTPGTSGNIQRHLSREGNGTPLQYSCLENPMGGGTQQAAVNGVAKSRTRLSDFTFTFHFYALEKEMATHSSVLAWRIPGTGEPGGLLSMGSHRVRHD